MRRAARERTGLLPSLALAAVLHLLALSLLPPLFSSPPPPPVAVRLQVGLPPGPPSLPPSKRHVPTVTESDVARAVREAGEEGGSDPAGSVVFRSPTRRPVNLPPPPEVAGAADQVESWQDVWGGRRLMVRRRSGETLCFRVEQGGGALAEPLWVRVRC